MRLKLRCPLRCALFCFLSLLATAAWAQTTINVGPGQAYTTIQSGIDAANNGDTVLVAPGTYNENIDFKGKAITVTSSGGAAVTIIDGGAAPGLAVVAFQSNEGRSSILSNFTIRNGGAVTFNSDAGGGIYIFQASPTILNNVITANQCDGIDAYLSAALIQGNTISGTSYAENAYCAFEPVGIVLEGNRSTMFNSVLGNTIENNTSPGAFAAAIFIWDSNGNIIVGNTIRNNVSSGGAVQMDNSESIIFSQNLVYGNSQSGTAYGAAGGLTLLIPDGAPPFYGIIANNTFANNTASANLNQPASQVFIDGDVSKFSFVNNILYGTGPSPLLICNSLYAYLSPGPMLVENNDAFNPSGPAYDSSCANGPGVAGNIAVDPRFNNPTNNDFHLQSGSPAIDAGNNQALTMLAAYGIDLATDLDGKPRVQDATGKGCIIDMGVYESPGTTADCGPSETLTSSLNPAFAGQTVTLTAQLGDANGTPTGSVQFLDGASPLSTQTVSGTGSASFATSSLTVGSHTITANYQPTGTFGAASASLTEVINGYPTSTALTCLPNPIGVDGTAQLTATVTSSDGTPTGSIAFADNGAALATSNLVAGTTSLPYTGAVAGTHTITATYAPTGSFTASSATCSEVVNALPTTSTLTVAPPNSTFGSPVTLTVTVAPANPPGPSTPTGIVTFYNGAASLGTGTLTAGVATLPLPSLPAGSYNLTCIYGGSAIYSSSNCNSAPFVVSPAATALTLSSSANPAPYLAPVTFTAHLSIGGQSAAAGNVIVLNIAGQLVNLTTDATGSASDSVATLPGGSDPVTAAFAATSNLLASSASLTQVITPLLTSISVSAAPNPGDLNQTVTLTADLKAQATQVAGGTVTFYDGTTSLGSSPVSATGTATLAATFTTTGVHALTASYSGDADFQSSTSGVFNETIMAGDFSIATSPTSAGFYTGQSTTVQVSVTSLNGFDQLLNLSCSGLPANATCAFSPATLPNGQGDVNLVIQTAAPAPSASASTFLLPAFLLFLLPAWKGGRGALARLCLLALACVVLTGAMGCGSNSSITGGTPPGTYQIAITATTADSSPPLTHAAVVTLTVKSLF